MQAKGDIYKGSYEGWYCAGCEAFFPESQLVDGRCPDLGHPVELLREESYFFRLSAYQEPLLRFYRDHPECVRPVGRYNEVVRFVEMGLKDLSVSRVSLKWGVPWPGDADHVVYVWLDALTNYVSALGVGASDTALYERYWPADLHLVGKDILRFHCVYWPAFLMSAGLPLPRQIYGHGWWLRDERKMSKSVGNVVKPDALLERFGPDPLRYFLLREMTFGQDANFSDEGFLHRYNADLANGLGNTASRVLAMAARYFDGRTPGERCTDNTLLVRSREVVPRYLAAMDAYEFTTALEAVWELLAAVDGYVNEKAPWSVAKAEGVGSVKLQRIIYNGLESLRLAALMVAPVMPAVAGRLLAQVGVADAPREEAALGWGGLPTGQPLGESGALFPRVDIEAYFAEANVDEKKTGTTQKIQLDQSGAIAATPGAGGEIDIEEFGRLKLVVGTVQAAERVPNSKKLVRIEVDLGEGAPRQIVAGIGNQYAPEQLVGRQIVVVANLKPAKLMGVESRGMLLAASAEGVPYLLNVDQKVPNGTAVK
jgi:methionyl-tRNA synthetase